MAKTAHECQTFADRELSQQTELLHQALESVDTALKEKNKSLAKLNSLDQCLDTLGDDELKSLTDKLFQDLETWVEENYGALHTNIEISEDRDIRSSPDSGIDDLPGPIGILADVSRCIFNVILCRFMVGTGNPSTLDQAFRMLDTTVQEICPTSVLKHWRSATSTASLSFGKSELKGILDHMVCEIESRYIPTGPSTAFGTKRRIQGLKSLLWRFIHLKGRMERQESLYYFLWIIPSMPFRDENMIRFPRPGDSTGIVERSLSPVLYKLASGHSQPTVVRRGLVKVRENIT
ncbi:hypothetical protein N7478_003959 [Penicillium angulare]|uniref:uncharacterized protein n=1 Tax=Penicillium angulare TaxID=116970 RepID=UPI00253F7C8D|nr:uncharacterized protein N7478_003959 [Penicillium angulare]KAJ5278587.1 hypothetical protein N7478_003959 [Penicillium angulare]